MKRKKAKKSSFESDEKYHNRINGWSVIFVCNMAQWDREKDLVETRRKQPAKEKDREVRFLVFCRAHLWYRAHTYTTCANEPCMACKCTAHCTAACSVHICTHVRRRFELNMANMWYLRQSDGKRKNRDDDAQHFGRRLVCFCFFLSPFCLLSFWLVAKPGNLLNTRAHQNILQHLHFDGGAWVKSCRVHVDL